MKTKEEILNTLIAMKPSFQKKYGVSLMGLFGSYAYGNPNENSDVDVLLDFNKSIGIEFIDICDELEQMIGIKTDVATVGALKNKPKLYEFIKQQVIYV